MEHAARAAARRRRADPETASRSRGPATLERLQSRGRAAHGDRACSARRSSPCVAYVDPGNFATNIAGGAKYGYLLLWVILAANLMAMLIQNLSAKLGIATGRNLPELCREHFPRPVTLGPVGPGRARRDGDRPRRVRRRGDRAEPAVRHPAVLGRPDHRRSSRSRSSALQTRGYRRFEVAIAGLLGVILLGFLYDTLRIGFDAGRGRRRASSRASPAPKRPARHRHPRRDRDAARDLPALGADAGPRSRRATTTSSARCCASSASTW